MSEVWSIFGPKMKPSWDQNGIKNRCKLRKAIFQKTLFFQRKIQFFWIKWVQVESQNRPKIDQKTESKMDDILASIFLGFWSIWEASWEGNRSQDRPKKASKNDAKKKSNEIAKKVAIRIPTDSRHPGSWVLGRG